MVLIAYYYNMFTSSFLKLLSKSCGIQMLTITGNESEKGDKIFMEIKSFFFNTIF